MAVFLVFFFSFTIKEVLGANQNLIAQLPDSPDGAGTPSTNTPTRPPSSNTTQQPTVPPTIEGARGILEQKKDYVLLAPLNYGNCTEVQQRDAGEFKTVCTISTSNVGTFFNIAVYSLIGLAALAAVVRIVYGGFLYLGSETFSLKEQGKEAIQNAIWGLIMVLSVYIILNTINPNLLNLNLNLKELMGGQIQFKENPGFIAERAAALRAAQEQAPKLIEQNTVSPTQHTSGASQNRGEVANATLPPVNMSNIRNNDPSGVNETVVKREYRQKCIGVVSQTNQINKTTGAVESIMTCIQK